MHFSHLFLAHQLRGASDLEVAVASDFKKSRTVKEMLAYLLYSRRRNIQND